jgi:RNA polymerase sigma factor (sigma-70 family)
MKDTSEPDRGNVDRHCQAMTDRQAELRAWFLREVLPLEAALTNYLGHHSRGRAGVADLLQDVYVRVYEAASKQLPESTKSFVFTTARNLLVDNVRHEKVVPIEAVENIEALVVAADEPGLETQVAARDELRHLQSALEHVAPRAREAFVLHHAHGLRQSEIAGRMGISVKTVSYHLNEAVQVLADILYGEKPGKRTKP